MLVPLLQTGHSGIGDCRCGPSGLINEKNWFYRMTFMVPWLGVGEDFAGKGLGGRYTITSIPSMTIGAQLVELHSGQRVMHAVCDSDSLSS